MTDVQQRLVRWADTRTPRPSAQLELFMGPVTPPRTVAPARRRGATAGAGAGAGAGARSGSGRSLAGLRWAAPGLGSAFTAAFVSMTTIAVGAVVYTTVGLPPGLRPSPTVSTPMISAHPFQPADASGSAGAVGPDERRGAPTGVTTGPSAKASSRGTAGSDPSRHGGPTGAPGSEPTDGPETDPAAGDPGDGAGSDTGGADAGGDAGSGSTDTGAPAGDDPATQDPGSGDPQSVDPPGDGYAP